MDRLAIDEQETIEQFLKRGDSVETVSPGESSEDEKEFNWNNSHYPVPQRRIYPIKASDIVAGQ